MRQFECIVWCPADRDANRLPREDETLEHLREAARDPGGGGGGNPGGTLESRLRDYIRFAPPDEAADTGGVADNPLITQEYYPGGQVGLGSDYEERATGNLPYDGLPGEYPPDAGTEE